MRKILKVLFKKVNLEIIKKVDEKTTIYSYKGIKLVDAVGSKLILKLTILALDEIPDNVMKKVGERLNLIRIDKGSAFPSKDIKGFFSSEDDIIYLRNNYIYIYKTVLHELGHALDFSLSNGIDKNMAYSIENNFFKSNLTEKDYKSIEFNSGKYFISNIKEVFAEASYYYFGKKNRNCNLYKVFDNIVKGL